MLCILFLMIGRFMANFKLQIIGPRNQPNGLLARFLKKEMGNELECSIQPRWSEPPGQQVAGRCLILLDGQGMGLEPFIDQLRSSSNPTQPGFFAVFNLSRDNMSNVVNREMLTYGLRGVFNVDEPMENIFEGIRAIFSNELWIPREILTQTLKLDPPPSSV